MKKQDSDLMDKIISLAKRRGFVFPSSEIYGGFAATYDFGPLGALLKKNIENAWRYWNVTSRTDMVEIDGAIFMHPKVWEASGHIGGFADLLVEDLVTHKRYRADHLIEEAGVLPNAGSLKPDEVDKLIAEHKIKSPEGNTLSTSKRFNLLVSTHLGSTEDNTSLVYLKGESCQNIYLDWKSVLETTRRKLPFGIAQIGKAFRNEITVKNFIFRTREFEQMDVQYFVKPVDAPKYYEEWKNNRVDFYTKFLEMSQDRIKYRQHEKDEKAFYATDAWDVEYNFEGLGFKEIEGIHDRGSYDLDQHSKFSGQDLSYYDPETKEKYNPYIVECSGGLNRLFLACMFDFYHSEQVEDEERVVMRFPKRLAPYKIAFLPLSKKDELMRPTFELYEKFRKAGISCDYDETASIGKRYRRQDEIGTPYCVTVDFETQKDQSVTVRDRDTMQQDRVKITELLAYFKEKLVS
jgi:glycyl-tRNA synthetase